ncbi:hypothetical protein N9466_07950 [Amylibacter sp.]|nr:hypothetical protein [Amylibacter sp.]
MLTKKITLCAGLFFISLTQCVFGKNSIQSNLNQSAIKKVDKYFADNPNQSKAILFPVFNQKRKNSFIIPKKGFLVAKKYQDSSDLYYYSKYQENKISLYPMENNNIDIFLSNSLKKLQFIQQFKSGFGLGMAIQNNGNSAIDLVIEQNLVVNDNLLNLNIKQSEKYPTFNVNLLRLSENENSEIFTSFFYEFKSSNIFGEIGNTWFDVTKNLDFTFALQDNNYDLTPSIHATYNRNDMRLHLGINEIKNKSNFNIFFNLDVEFYFKNQRINTHFSSNPYGFFEHYFKQSLKPLRKNNADQIWRKLMQF